jgi:hypothetical protein
MGCGRKVAPPSFRKTPSYPFALLKKECLSANDRRKKARRLGRACKGETCLGSFSLQAF